MSFSVLNAWIIIRRDIYVYSQTSVHECLGSQTPRITNVSVQERLGSRTPRITNSSVHKQIFQTQSVWDDVLCLGLRTRKLSTCWSDKLAVSASVVFGEETYTKTDRNAQLFSETETRWV